MIKRRKTRRIQVGGVPIGGGAPISVQSMTNTDTRNARSTLAQIRRLAAAGCEIVRVAVPDEQAAAALPGIVKGSPIPVIADIHFNYRLARASCAAGVHGLRINPGTIGGRERFCEVVRTVRDHGIALRIGINAGSLEKDILRAHGRPTVAALVESALRAISEAERLRCRELKVSIKSSDVPTTIAAHRLLSRKTNYPLHIGVTEAGTLFSGTIKSSVGLGILLAEGIGDTLRVSLAADPTAEVRAGFTLLRCLGLRDRGPEIIACPTCGRRRIDVIKIAAAVERRCADIVRPIRIAVMGCEVNGPGEAREADIGLAGSASGGVIFKKGVIVKRCPKNGLLDTFLREVRTCIGEMDGVERG